MRFHVFGKRKILFSLIVVIYQIFKNENTNKVLSNQNY